MVAFGAAGFNGKGVQVQAAQKTINGCKYLTENTDYRLYVNEEDLSLVIEDKKSGSNMTMERTMRHGREP